MFYTAPEAELPLPTALAPGGERAWHWVELGLSIPYFLATVRHSDESEALRHERTMMFCDVGAIVQLAKDSCDGFKLVRVALFSPGYMNGTGTYQLNQLAEVWQDPASGEQRFLLADGTRLEMQVTRAARVKMGFKRIFAMPPH